MNSILIILFMLASLLASVGNASGKSETITTGHMPHKPNS